MSETSDDTQATNLPLASGDLSFPLTGTDKEQIVLSITRDEKRLQDIDVQLADLQSALRSLQVNRDDLQHSIWTRKDLIAPIHALPAELLRQIFTYCLPDDQNALRAGEAPLLLTSICRRWRQVAEAHPILWTRIYVTGASVHGLPYLIARSGGFPLSFIIRVAEFFGHYDAIIIAIQLIREQLHRCQSLHASFPEPTPLSLLFPTGQTTQLPELEELELEVGEAVEIFSLLGPIDAPRLRTFAVPDPTALDVGFGVPYPLLTVLRVHMLPEPCVVPGMLPALLFASTALVELEIRLTDAGPVLMRGILNLPPLRMTQLRRFDLSFSTFTLHVDRLFRRMEFPALEQLRIYNYDERVVRSSPFPMDWQQIVGRWRTRQSIPPLKELILERVDVGQELMQPLLLVLDQLEHVDLRRCIGVGDLLADLTRFTEQSPADPWILPRLTVISISESYIPHLHLVEFARQRVQIPPRDAEDDATVMPLALLELRLSKCPGLDARELEDLAGLLRVLGQDEALRVSADQVHVTH